MLHDPARDRDETAEHPLCSGTSHHGRYTGKCPRTMCTSAPGRGNGVRDAAHGAPARRVFGLSVHLRTRLLLPCLLVLLATAPLPPCNRRHGLTERLVRPRPRR